MNFNKRQPSPRNNQTNNNQSNRRQKTIPSPRPNNMNTNATYNNAHTGLNNNNPYNSNPKQYNQTISPRNTNTKSPRPKKKKSKKKDKRPKNIPDNSMHRVRSHTIGHHVLNNKNNNVNINVNNINNNPALYMSTTQNISSPRGQSNHNQWNTQHRTIGGNILPAPISPRERGNSPHGNQYHKQSNGPSIGPPPPQRNVHKAWNSGNMNNNMNTDTTHNQTGTMIKHMNQNTLGSNDHSSLYDDIKYHNRQDCVWSIKLFQQPEVANNFACQTCCDIPKTDFAYTCDKELIYCEYCIDIKYRQHAIKQKKRMPIMVQNMINELKCKCCHYSSCKWRGNIRNLTEHLQLCSRMLKKKKSSSNKSASECPLKYLGCVQFKGGYINEHYNEYNEQHLNYIIQYFDNKLRKYDTNYQNKLQKLDIQIKTLQNENITLTNQINNLLQLNNNNINNNNGYKIVVNNQSAEHHNQMSMNNNTINSERSDRNNQNNNQNNQNNNTNRKGNWNSFMSAHRRLSTKTGATIPETAEDVRKYNNYANQLLSNPHSFNTQTTTNNINNSTTNDDAKQMELPITDQKMVVIDIGSQLSKVGLAGSNKPTHIFQSMVASHELNGSRSVGKATDKLTNYKCSFPVDRGIISSSDDYESIIHSIFYDKLQISPHEYNALLIEPILSTKKQSLKILEICFEKFNLNALFLATDALCALYASGGNTGLSVSSGHGITSVVPIYEGYVIPHAAQKLEYGGNDITNYLKDKLNLNGLFRSLLSENKFADSLKQKLSYIATDFKIEKQHTMFERIVYRLPDGTEIEVGQERFECCEQLFNNNMNNGQNTLQNLINKSLLNANQDIRQVLFENIVCSGGNTMLKGFDDRLKKEVDNNAPENSGWKTRIFGLVDRKLSCWIGGSIMASLSHMDQLWITRKQYKDIGPNILNQQY